MRLFHVPEGLGVTTREKEWSEDEVATEARARPDEIEDVARRLRENRDRILAPTPIEEILSRLERVLERWRDPSYDLRTRAEEWVARSSGLSLAMVRLILDRTFTVWRADALERMLRMELGDPQTLDRFVSIEGLTSRRWATGPRLITQVVAGNIPILAVWGIVTALLVKSSVLIKPSIQDPVLGSIFARSVEETDPDLGQCVAVIPYPGGDEELERAAYRWADLVVASGSDEAMRAIRNRVGPKTRFLGHGHRLSICCVSREALTMEGVPDAAARVARDASLYDQRGCLSPQICFVEQGGEIEPREFAIAIAGALDRFCRTVPRGRIPGDVRARIGNLIETYELRKSAGDAVDVFTGTEGGGFTLLYDEDEKLPDVSPQYRTLFVKATPSLKKLPLRLQSIGRHLQSVGMDRTDEALAAAFGDLGAARICPIGRMQEPPVSWALDGRFQIQDWIRFVDLE